jgi:hypothetical protein
MLKKACIVFIVLLVIPCISNADVIDVQIKGVDDGVKTTKQQDYKEALLFAKRVAIERAGVKDKALTTAKDFVIHSDYIESKAAAVLLPGYNVVDVGYQTDGTYLVILIGKVKTSTPDLNSKVVVWDGSFVKYANGVVYDKNTGLEWYAGPDKDTNWNRAKQWVKRQQVAGGGWRMPTLKELKTLYEKDVGTYNMTPLLETTGWYVWSGETKESSSCEVQQVWYFDFYSELGYRESLACSDYFNDLRGFAVRSRR